MNDDTQYRFRERDQVLAADGDPSANVGAVVRQIPPDPMMTEPRYVVRWGSVEVAKLVQPTLDCVIARRNELIASGGFPPDSLKK